MAIQFRVVNEVPGGRNSRGGKTARLISEVYKSPTGLIAVESNDPGELHRTYKALIQYRSRNKQQPFGMKKVGGTLYIWASDTDCQGGTSCSG